MIESAAVTGPPGVTAVPVAGSEPGGPTAAQRMARLALSPALAALREAAHRRQRLGAQAPPTLPLIDAAAWRDHDADEDWLLWRARRTAARLAAMPIDVAPTERIVGRPELRAPTPAEARQIEAVGDELASIPPFPGGDAGHFQPDIARLLRLGLGGLRRHVGSLHADATGDREAFYRACGIALDGLSRYVERVGDACDRVAAESGDEGLRALAASCRRLAGEPPATFHEALQLLFLTIVGLWFGEDHALTTPGRMDQTLRPFYDADVAAGRLDAGQAFELICGLYVQLNHLLGPGSALSVMVGGRDRRGRDATHELTWLCLAARRATRLVYPTVGLAWHEGTPGELVDYAGRLLADGLGDPAFFNDEVIVAGLRDHGVREADAYDYMNSTCVEIKPVGAAHVWVTAPYINCPQQLLDLLDDVAADGGAEPATFADFEARLRQRFVDTVGAAARRLDEVWRQRAETGGFPLASCLIADCLERGLDFDRGGARYNWVENSFVGLANLVDSLVTVEQLVYTRRELSLGELRDILRADFEGHEALRQRILNRLPSYGTADPEADAVAARWAEALIDITEAHSVGPHRYVPGFFCWVMHGRLGETTGATPDGRRAGTALADGAGAAQGRDRRGPTASVLSTTAWSHRAALGGLVHNVRFSHSLLSTPSGLRALRDVVETYLRRGGFEIQVNVVSPEVLRAARERPQDYGDLLVRVAGYSDYFVHLDATLQDEVIARTEHATA